MFRSGADWNGNASGRPKKSDEQKHFEQKCREWLHTYAFDKLRRAADSPNENRAQWALDKMFEYGFLKNLPVQYIDADITAHIGSAASDLAREVTDLIGASTVSGSESPSKN